MLFSLLASCAARRHVEQQQGSHTVLTQGIVVQSDSTSASVSERDTASLSAAFQAQQSGEGRSTELDTSRTVIVTEFSPDGLPVRQTETRLNAIVRSNAWSSEQQLQVDVYLRQIRELNEQCSAALRMLAAMRDSSRTDTLSHKSESVPAEPSTLVKWVAGLEILMAWLVVFGIFGAVLWRKLKS